MPAVDRIGLLVDGQVAYDSAAPRYFDIEDSFVAISNLTSEAEMDLQAKGYELAFVEAPFVGGFQNAGSVAPLASTRSAKPEPSPDISQ